MNKSNKSFIERYNFNKQKLEEEINQVQKECSHPHTVCQLCGKSVGEIDEIQSLCSHPSPCLTKEHKSNTGNYDPSSDCYWTEFNCSLCGKRWTEVGSV